MMRTGTLVFLFALAACTNIDQPSVIYQCVAKNEYLDGLCSETGREFNVSFPDGDGHAEVAFTGTVLQFIKKEEGHFSKVVESVQIPLILSFYGQTDGSNPSLTMSYLLDANRTTDASIELDIGNATRLISGNCILQSPEGQ